MNAVEMKRLPMLQVVGGSSEQGQRKEDRRSTELRFAQELAADPRYTQSGGIVYFWNGIYHQALERKQMTVRAFNWLENHQPDHATPSRAESCVDAVHLRLAELPARDDKRVLIPLRNGYLEATDTGEFQWLKPDPSLGLTYVLNVELPRDGATYQPRSIPCGSLLEHFFSTSLPNLDARNYLQEMAGDTLIPNIRFQRAAMLKGDGRNGKSIFTKLMAAVHHRVAYKQLNQLSGFNLMDLVGASLAIVPEVSKTGLDEQAFKAIVSGETMSVDVKYQNPISVQMTAKWLICTNNDQRTSDNSFGFWRRVVIIPFDHTVLDADVIPELDDKIIEHELAFFLDWCLLGLQRLLARGDMAPLPAVLQQAKQSAIQASDPVQDWIEQRFVAISDKPVCKQKIYDHFYDWCLSQGYRQPPLANLFWKAVKSHFGEKKLDECQVRVLSKRSRCVHLRYE